MNDDDLPPYSVCPDCDYEALYKEQQKVEHLTTALRRLGERIVLEYGNNRIPFEAANALAVMVEAALRAAAGDE